MLFTLRLLPLLKASSHHPRVVSILRAGQEHADIDLDDLDAKKPAKSNWDYVMRCGSMIETLNTVCLDQLAEQNPEVTFVHKFPGLVKTAIFSGGWGKAWSFRRVMFTYVVPAVVTITGMSDEEVGQRCLYTLFSARYGGGGVKGSESEEPLANSKGGKGHEGAFLVKEDDEAAVNTKVLGELRRRGVPSRVLEETLTVTAP